MQNSDDSTYAAMGMAAMIPGMQRMIELMQAELDKMRAQLAAAQGGTAKSRAKQPPRGTDEYRAYDREVHRKLRAARKATADLNAKGKPIGDAYWAAMTAEERSAEMRRRQALRKSKRKLHPSNLAHPDHAAWAANLSKARKAAWAKMTPAQQKAKLAQMAAGRANGAAA